MARRDIDKAPRVKRINGYRVEPGRTILEMIRDDLSDASRAYLNATERLERSPGDRLLLNKQKTARGMMRAYATCIEHHVGPHTDPDEVIANIERSALKEVRRAIQQAKEDQDV